jgi:hypothetical protein
MLFKVFKTIEIILCMCILPNRENFQEKILLYMAYTKMAKCSSNTIMIRFSTIQRNTSFFFLFFV